MHPSAVITQTSESLNEEGAILQGKGGLRASGAVDSVEEKRSELLNLRKEVAECLDSSTWSGKGVWRSLPALGAKGGWKNRENRELLILICFAANTAPVSPFFHRAACWEM